MILDRTNRKLTITLGGAITTNPVNFAVHYMDQFKIALTDVENLGSTAVGTAVDMVVAPAANTTRFIKEIQIQNADTVSATVTVSINTDGTITDLKSIAVAAGKTLLYNNVTGWQLS